MTAPQPEETTQQWLARLLGVDMLLWSPNVQAQAFMHLDRIFATRTVKARAPASPLPYAATPLEVTYEDYGKPCTIDDLIRDDHLSGLLVMKDGTIHLERYALGLSGEQVWQSSSVVKSLTSTLVGAAVHDGSIGSIGEKITHYIPELDGTAYGEATIRDLLMMSSGAGWREDYADIDADVNRHYIKAIAERRPGYILKHLCGLPSLYRPGEQFYYSTGEVFLLSILLSRATGRTVADYCSERIWTPCGMERDSYFILDSDGGHEITGSRWSACLRDYARFGALMCNDGVTPSGVRILPEGWVREAGAPCAPRFHEPQDDRPRMGEPSFFGYGYLWWVPHPGAFMAVGSAGQWIYVEPEARLVIVMLSAMPHKNYLKASDPASRQAGSRTKGPRRLAFVESVRQAMGGR